MLLRPVDNGTFLAIVDNGKGSVAKGKQPFKKNNQDSTYCIDVVMVKLLQLGMAATRAWTPLAVVKEKHCLPTRDLNLKQTIVGASGSEKPGFLQRCHSNLVV